MSLWPVVASSASPVCLRFTLISFLHFYSWARNQSGPDFKSQQLFLWKRDSPPACVITPLDPSGIYLFTEVSLGAGCSGLFAFPT